MNLLEGVLWLTLNVYHEARSDNTKGQLAVAHVTMNRSKNRKLPIKEVVQQPFQFSWTMEGKLVPDDMKAFKNCLETATIAAQTADFTKGATHFHHVKIVPEWTNRMTYVGTFGSHSFYIER